MPSSSPVSPSRVLTAQRVFCLALVGLHLAAPLFTEAAAWGLWPFTYLPRAVQLLLAGLAILTILPHTAAALLRIAQRVLHASLRNGSQSRFTFHRRNTLFALLSLLSLLFFSLFRIVHTRWGDAYILVNAIAYPDPA